MARWLWRFRLPVVGPAACGVALFIVALALADGRSHLNGNATVDRSTGEPVLILDAHETAGDVRSFHAELSVAGRSRGSNGTDIVDLQGPFEATDATGGTTTGTASMRLDNQVSGTLHLENGSGISFDAEYILSASGDFGLDISLPAPVLAAAPDEATDAVTDTGPVNHTWWYVSRASGLTAYLLLFATVCTGLAVRARLSILARWQWFDIHQVLSLTALAFVGLHILSLLGDVYIGFTVRQLLVPFASSYRPNWVALGVMAAYLTLITTGSFYIRRQIGYRTWRTLHYLTFACYVLALGHGVLSGSDSGAGWGIILYWATGVTAATLFILRLLGATGGQGETSSRARPLERGGRPV